MCMYDQIKRERAQITWQENVTFYRSWGEHTEVEFQGHGVSLTDSRGRVGSFTRNTFQPQELLY